MENNEYLTTPYVKSEHTNQENKKKTETTASSIEEQYFDLPLKERMKIQNKRMKLKIQTKSQELKAKAKIQSEKIRAKSIEIREKIHTKIEEYKAHENKRQQPLVSKNHKVLDKQPPEPSKYCSDCGVQVSISGRFCPGCGAMH